MEEIIEKIKANGWIVEKDNKGLIIYPKGDDRYYGGGSLYKIRCNGVYAFIDRGEERIFNFDNLLNNLLAFYMYILNSKKTVNPGMNAGISDIDRCNSIEEIAQIYNRFFDREYIMTKINMNPRIIKDNALNFVVYDNHSYQISIAKDGYMLHTPSGRSFKAGKKSVYSDMFRELFKYKQFEETEERILRKYNLTGKNILGLYSIYNSGIQTSAFKISEWKKEQEELVEMINELYKSGDSFDSINLKM